MLRTVWLSGLALVLLAAPVAAEVLVDPPCGSVITGKAVLTQDMSCAHTPAYELKGGDAFLDMRGHTLDNAGGGRCITLSGRGARLRNGRVTNCGTSGVAFSAQGGGHTVDRMNASNNQESGFSIKSDDNTLRFVTANENVSYGIAIFGSNGNRVLGATTTGNLEGGIGVLDVGVPGEGNQILRSTANNNRRGINDQGINTVVSGNRAEANTRAGFRYEGAGGTYKLNDATENTTQGFAIQGSDGLFLGNTAEANGGNGFRVLTAAIGNTLRQNRAFGNSSFDIQDEDGDCVDNTYVGNRFDSSNAACVQ